MGSHYMGNTVRVLECSILATNHADGFDHILKITKNNLNQIKISKLVHLLLLCLIVVMKNDKHEFQQTFVHFFHKIDCHL
jgi:hypothetical protein